MSEQLSLPLTVPTLPREASLAERFWAFHEANPQVYRALERRAQAARNLGRSKVGVGLLCELVRWDSSTVTHPDGYKINNSHRAFYARLLLAAHPEWAGFIDIREQRAA